MWRSGGADRRRCACMAVVLWRDGASLEGAGPIGDQRPLPRALRWIRWGSKSGRLGWVLVVVASPLENHDRPAQVRTRGQVTRRSRQTGRRRAPWLHLWSAKRHSRQLGIAEVALRVVDDGAP